MPRSIKVLSPPEGFQYRGEFLVPAEEAELERKIADLPFKEFEFHGYPGKRRVVSFGWRYDFGEQRLARAGDIPYFLLPIRERAAKFASLEPEHFAHILVTEYTPGTAIGWHRDRGVFGDIVGVSLHSACIFRFRRALTKDTWERHSLTLAPRSAYLLRGASRSEWKHSIAPVAELRYSITFRSLRSKGGLKQAKANVNRYTDPQMSFVF